MNRNTGVENRTGLLSPKVAAFLIAAVVYVGLVANRDIAASLAAGNRLDLSESTAGVWQYVREGLTLILAGALALGATRHKGHYARPWAVSITLFGVLVFICFQFVRVFFDDSIPDVYAFLGLRFLYLASIIASVTCYSLEQRTVLLRCIAWWLVPILFIQAGIAFQQIVSGPAVLGTTSIGARPWGTYASSNNLGLALLGIFLILVLSRIRYWKFFCLIVAVFCYSTGSRSTILAIALVVAGVLLSRVRGRILLVPFGLVILAAAYFAVSSEGVSGREIQDEGRISVWAGALAAIDGPVELILGKGLGVGTNAVTVLVGKSGLSTPAVVDSTLVSVLLSLGIFGVFIFLGALAYAIRHMTFERRLIVLPALVLVGLTFNLPELSPINILGAVAIGTSLRRGALSPKGQRPIHASTGAS